MKIYQPGWGAQLRMAGYSLGALVLVVAWAFDVIGAASLPVWLVGGLALVAWFGLPWLETRLAPRVDLSKAIEDDERKPFPSFPVWILQNFPFCGILASSVLFSLSSGMITNDPFRVNLGIKISAVMFAVSIVGMSGGPLLEEWTRRRSADTTSRRRAGGRRPDGPPRR